MTAEPQIFLSWLAQLFTITWLTSLWRTCWQGGLVILLVWLLCRRWLAVPPRLRVWLWRLAYLKLLAVLVWGGAVTLNFLPTIPRLTMPKLATQPASPAAVHQPAPTTPTSTSTIQPTAETSPQPVPTVIAGQPTAHPSLNQPVARPWQLADLPLLLGALWLLGILWGVNRLLLSMRLVHRLRREGHPVGEEALLRLRVQMVKQMGLRKAPMLLAHPTEGPLLLGMFHPVIIVPEAMLTGSEEELQLALAHELAHVRRRDILWGWLPVVAEVLFFFHPLVYLARREYRLAQEIATDAQALHRTGAAPKTYGAMLLNGAAVQAGFRPVPVAVGIMESYQILHRRLTAMKHFTCSPRQDALAGMLVCLLALVGLVPWRLTAANTFAGLQIPPPAPQPVPNARDIYLQAFAKVISKGPFPDGTKYFYEDIFDMYLDRVPPGNGMISRTGQPAPSLPEMQAIMSYNQPAFDLLRQGFTAEYRELPARSFSEQFDFTQYPKFRNIARALMADAYTRSCAGDWSGAMGCDLDTVQFGVSVSHGGTLISYLVGAAIAQFTRGMAWEALPHLSVVDAKAGARRIETIMAGNKPLPEILQEMKWSEESRFSEVFQAPDWQQKLPAILVKNIPPQVAPKINLKGLNPQTALTEYNRYMDELIAYSKQPYATRQPKPVQPQCPLTPYLPPDSATYDKLRFIYTCRIAQNAQLLTGLALHAYHAEHNAYPEDMAVLVPTYLTAVPVDPFGSGEPLRYRRTADWYLLYSIGPDGKDDGGTPSIDGTAEAKSQEHRAVLLTSTGDIVAGVNTR